ncbi:hypothetical protein J2W36_000193 [Variovorax ginsengisoli]|uniref:DUF3348 domain-containing protein n=1 Tax=Variovorax ginsengisoli TaxID=363844 RepID=A0ABT9S0T4_9BURK|nr:hypothetical protein [Variovorax ginsengisoli]
MLARLGDTDVPESRQSFADRLSQWLRWTDAIALSTALDGGLMAAPAGARAASVGAEEAECLRVRTMLMNDIAEDFATPPGKVSRHAPALAPDASMSASSAFAPYRRRYLTRQQAMVTRIAPLRSRVRAALATRSPDMARLAAVDGVMEQALGAREHALLATVPTLLERHFARLRSAHDGERAAPAEGAAEPPEHVPGPSALPDGAWLDAFCQDMQGVLLAELDIRLQPVEGLLDALRMK